MPGIERIRYTTSHPRELTQRLIDAYAQPAEAGVAPAPAGAVRLRPHLAAMKRGYTVLEYKSIIRRLRAVRPDQPVSSDFIVGFPGETEADFEATMKLIRRTGLRQQSFSFVYSARPGTPAADLADDTPQAVKLARLPAAGTARTPRRRPSAAMVGSDAAHVWSKAVAQGRCNELPVAPTTTGSSTSPDRRA
jgi:tRNA-2-methylthio-N6-dimethylallyladenosine synthase